MFPFLAPIKSADHVERQGTGTIRLVEITFLADSPHVSRANSVASTSVSQRVRENSGSSKSRSNEGLNVPSTASRPSSRQKTSKSPLVSSQPTSARSEKSSPLPPTVPVPDTIPPPSRHKNKGLEVSSAMMEMFGGGSSAFGAGSAFETIPPHPKDQNFHRKNVLAHEFEQKTQFPQVKNAPDAAESAFKTVENHDTAYERAVRRARGESQFSQEATPGPEWFEGFEKLDMTGIELPPDPNCPAEKYLREKDQTPDDDSDWRDAKEDVLQASGSVPRRESGGSKVMAESVPGPDLGDEEEEEEVAEVSTTGNEPAEDVESKGSGGVKDEPHSPTGEDDEGADGQSAGRDAEDASESEDKSRHDGQNTDSDSDQKKKGDGDGAGDMALFIRNAQIVNDDSIFVADVLVQEGIIVNVGPNIEAPPDAQIIDASGKMLLPAGIDVHTQFTSPESADDLATGCRAALAGGTATVVEVVAPKAGESATAAFGRVKASLDKALCNVSLSVTIKQWNETTKKDMEKLVSDGVNSFLVDVDGDDALYQLLEHSRSLGAHVRILPENRKIISLLEKKMLGLGVTGPEGFPQSRPEELESDRVNNICVISQLANCPVSILSVSSSESLGSIERARNNGALAHAEVATAAVTSDANGYSSKDLKEACAHLTEVPLRKDATSRLLSALASQPLVVCTSGHKAVSTSTKTSAKDFTSMAKGSVGAEERMSVVWEKAVRTGRIDLMRFVAVTSSNAAKVFNMYPQKGRIAVGADADLVLWDPSSKRILSSSDSQSSVDVSLFDGLTVHASVHATIVGGRVAWKDGGIKDAKGGFVALTPNSPHLFSMVSMRDKFGNVEKVEREASFKPSANGHKPTEFDRDRNRKHLMESSIDFGGNSRNRNPPGGRTTGFW